MSDKDSRLISSLRFPLAVMVVFIHCGNRPFMKSGEWFRVLLADVLPAIAVPLFFLISGYLFFQGLEKWNWNEWRRKMNHRIKTLLIPYLIWVTLYIAYVYLHQCRLSLGESGSWLPLDKWIFDNGGIRMWWDSIVTRNSYPLGYETISAHPFHRVMWFVRDLLVINLLSPVIHWALRQGGLWFLLTLLILNILQLWPPLHSLGITCVFYYSAGSYLAIKGKGLTESFSKGKVLWWVIAGTLIVPMVVFRKTDFYLFVRPIWCIVWSFSFVNLIGLCHEGLSEKKINSLADSTFFIYVTHSIVLSNIRQALLVLPSIDLGEVNVFILTGLISVSACLLIYWLLHRCLPRTCALICGR